MVGRGELEMIRVCRSGVLGMFVKITQYDHVLYCFLVQRNSLGSIALSVHRCMQNAELASFNISAQEAGKGPFHKGLRSLIININYNIKPD